MMKTTRKQHLFTKCYWESFPGLKNVREIKGADGFYRYIVGEYKGFSEAKSELTRIKEIGYPQAFIKEVSLLENQTLNQK